MYIHANTKEDTSKYYEIFTAISNQTEYDDLSLAESLGYQSNSNSLTANKNYLFQLILKSLRSYYYNPSSENIYILGLLMDTELLFQKKIYKPCYKIIQKIQKICAEKNLVEYQVIANAWEIKVAMYVFKLEEYWNQLNLILDRAFKSSQSLDSKIVLLGLYKQAQSHNMIYGVLKNKEALIKFKQLSRHPMLQNYDFSKPNEPAIYYHLFFITYYIGLRNLDQQLIWNKKLNLFFEKHPLLKSIYLDLYVEAKALCIFNLLELRDFQNFSIELENFKQIKIPVTSSHIYHFWNSEYLYLRSYSFTMTGEFDTILKELKMPIESYYKNMRTSMKSKNEIWMVGNLSWAYLGIGELEKALHWATSTIQLIDKNTQVDLYIIFRSVELIIHYQMGNSSVVSSITTSLRRYINSKNKMNLFEDYNLRFFKKASKSLNIKSEQKEILKELKADILKINEDDLKKSIIQPDRVLFWIESQLSGKTLKECIAEYKKNMQKF